MDTNKQISCGGRSVIGGSRSPIKVGTQALLCMLGMLLLSFAPANAQQRVSGRVTAVTGGEPIAAVQVTVQGTQIRAQTDAQGRYDITAPSGTGTLVFSRVGFATITAPIGNRGEINVQLAVQATQLEGIVAIGYGEKTRPTITESIGVVDAEQIQRVTVASPDQAIQGRVPGVQVTTESGVPGAPVQMRIRGVGTVGNTQPLFVIDGVPVGKGTGGTQSPLATINPNDIESISVLKDASAASVYGMQAANGVVLIQTRRGKLGKPTIRYDGYTGVQQMPQSYDLLNTQQWLALQEEAIAANNAYFGRTPSDPAFGQLPVQLRQGAAGRDELLARNTDWTQVAIKDNAPIQNHNVSISGATDQVNYYVSGGYFAQDAIVEKWDLARYSFRANSDFNITERLRVGETFTLSNQVTLRGAGNYGDGTILNNTLQQPPIFVSTDPALVSPTNPQGLSGNFGTLTGVTRPNLNSTNQLTDVIDRNTRVLGGVHAEFDLFNGLTLRTQNSLDYIVGNRYVWNEAFTNEMTGFARSETAEDLRNEAYTVVSTNTATYENAFGDHNLNLLAGVETNMARGNGLTLQGTGFINTEEGLRRFPALASNILARRGSAFETNRLGFIGRMNYNFADRYLLTASVRRDAVSTFAPGNQWGTFPAFSAGWRVSEEPWFNVGWVDELKLRGSWGQLGNSDIPGGDYPHLVNVLLWADYEIGGQVQLAPTPQPRLANAGLTWETNETTDFGFETSLFGNAVDFAATYYKRNTENFLINVPTPTLSGFTSAPLNVGLMRNSGVELEAGYNTRIRDAVDFTLSGNLTTVDNELVSLTEGVEQFQQSGFYRTSVGFPVGYFYGFQSCGVFQTPAEAAAGPTRSGNQAGAGDLCFRDINGRDATTNRLTGQPDGRLTDDDRAYLGKTIPDAYYGINLNAAFKALDFTAFFNGVTGVQRYNELGRSLQSLSGGYSNQLANTVNRWTPANPSNTMPRAIGGDPAGNNRLSDRWVEDGDYFRLKTLQLGYTLPDNLFGSRATGTRLYVSATNLWTVTDYSGLDPEFSTAVSAFGGTTNSSQLGAGTDTGNIPQPRMFQIGLTTTF